MRDENGRPLIGYARVSTADQKLDLQMDALIKFGVDRDQIYTDRGSGSDFKRPGLMAALKALRSGDTLVVWKVDRLGRSLYEVTGLVDRLTKRDILLVSITENYDARTAMGKLVFQIMVAMGELERNLIIERTLAGQAASRARGKVPGRRDKMDDDPEIEERILKLLAERPPIPHNQIAALLSDKISRTKFYNWLSDNPEKVAAIKEESDK